MSRSDPNELLLGEWACLGLLCQQRAHGFAVAARLKPHTDIGRVWSMSRALTYRALDQLEARQMIEKVAEERGIAGGNRTVLAPTPHGRAEFRRWVRQPVEHLRDLRSELLLKILLGQANDIDLSESLDVQHDRIAEFITLLDRAGQPRDVVDLWRRESAAGALRFLERCRRLRLVVPPSP
ncbi:MAG: PadR family transcriptional regulator [Actinomycetota bacterium]